MQDFGSGLANVGKTALSIAGDVGFNVLISAGLTAAGKAWDNYSNKQENAIEKGNEALSNYKQTNSTMQEATSWIKDNAERYTELSKGATSLGEQGSLTDAEFKEYNELSAQMATYLPSQIKGYNSLGTAILSVGDSTKQVNNALQSEKLTQYAKSANEASDVIDKYIAEMYQDSGITKETGITNKQKAIEDFLNDYQNGNVKRAYKNSTDYLHSNGSYGNGYSSIYGGNKNYMSTYMDNGNLKDAFKAAGIKGSGWFGGYTKEDYLNKDNINTLRNYQQQLSTEAQTSVDAIKEIMPAFLQSNKDYLKLTDNLPEMDSMISSIYSNFDKNGIESILGGNLNDLSSEEAEKGIKVKKWIKYRDDNRNKYIEVAKNAADASQKVNDIVYRNPADDLDIKQWDDMNEDGLNESLKYYNSLLTSLQVSVDPNWDASNNDFSTYKPWTKADGSVDHDKYLEKLKAQENGYGGYYTYYDILHYIIPNIEIAIRNLKKVDEKKEDYVKDWETNWDLYGTSELDALNKKYTEELEKVQDYAKPWSELTDEEKRANSGNKDSYNIYHNKYVEIYGYISANGTLTAAIAKRNQEKKEAQKILDGYNSQMSSMKISASINNADYGFTDEDKTVIYSLFHDQDYQNNNIVSTSVDTSVTEIDRESLLKIVHNSFMIQMETSEFKSDKMPQEHLHFLYLMKLEKVF